MVQLTTFEESKNVAEQLNLIISIIYSEDLTKRENKILAGLALGLSHELRIFCSAGARDEAGL